jgi:hypothetical protein
MVPNIIRKKINTCSMKLHTMHIKIPIFFSIDWLFYFLQRWKCCSMVHETKDTMINDKISNWIFVYLIKCLGVKQLWKATSCQLEMHVIIICNRMFIIIYINSLRPSVWRGFWGVGEGEAGEAAGDRCQSVTRIGPPRFPCTNCLHKAL